MKYIILPTHPNWARLIMNGIKDIEVRSGMRLFDAINRLKKEQGCAPCLTYVTKGQPCLFAPNDKNKGYFVVNRPFATDYLNGKVVAKFEADAEEISIQLYGGEEYDDYKEIRYETPTVEQSELLRRACLTYQQTREYLGEYPKREPIGTATYIHNPKVFDKPKKLKEFDKNGSYRSVKNCPKKNRGECNEGISPFTGEWCGCDKARLTHAPQSWCYCEAEE